jgi:hypothetical protein
MVGWVAMRGGRRRAAGLHHCAFLYGLSLQARERPGDAVIRSRQLKA